MEVSDFDAARALLPAWTPWIAPVLYLACLILIAFVLQRVLRAGNESECGVRRNFEGEEEHWTQRARRVWGRRVLWSQLHWVLALVGMFFGAAWIGPFSAWNKRYFVGCVLVVLYTVMLLGAYGIEAAVHEKKLSFRDYVRGRVAGLLLLHSVFVWAVANAILMPSAWTWTTLGLAIASLGVLFWLLRGGNFVLVRMLGLAQAADTELQNACDRAAEDVGTESVPAWICDGVGLNAFAMPAVPGISFTRMAQALPFDETRAIARHEHGHLLETARQRLLRRLPLGILVLCAFFAPLSEFGFVVWLQLVLISVVAVFFFGARLIKLEEEADEHAHGGEQDESYARALERIHSHNMIPAVIAGQNKSHPDLFYRMQKAGVEPDFAKPAPPISYRRSHFFGCFAILFMLAGLEIARAEVVRLADDPALALAFEPEPEYELEALAERAQSEERREDAVRFYKACDALGRGYRIDIAAQLALLSHELGRHDDAKKHLAAARERRDRRIEVPPDVEELLQRARAQIED